MSDTLCLSADQGVAIGNGKGIPDGGYDSVRVGFQQNMHVD